MKEIKSLGYKDKPNYEKLRSIMQTGLKTIHSKDGDKLEFGPLNGAVSLNAQVSTHSDTCIDTNIIPPQWNLQLQVLDLLLKLSYS